MIHINAPQISSTAAAQELVAEFGRFSDTTTLLWTLVDSRKAGGARVTEMLQLVASGSANLTVPSLLLPMLKAFMGPPDATSILQEKPLAMLLRQVGSQHARMLQRPHCADASCLQHVC